MATCTSVSLTANHTRPRLRHVADRGEGANQAIMDLGDFATAEGNDDMCGGGLLACVGITEGGTGCARLDPDQPPEPLAEQAKHEAGL
jgi:hypothetical protein